MPTEYTQCPFCKEKDFDLIGLKHHFEKGHCEVYNETDFIHCGPDTNEKILTSTNKQMVGAEPPQIKPNCADCKFPFKCYYQCESPACLVRFRAA
jgi:hypothetical protein